jgi:hypothetical protein
MRYNYTCGREYRLVRIHLAGLLRGREYLKGCRISFLLVLNRISFMKEDLRSVALEIHVSVVYRLFVRSISVQRHCVEARRLSNEFGNWPS